jgi:hypothetical protein
VARQTGHPREKSGKRRVPSLTSATAPRLANSAVSGTLVPSHEHKVPLSCWFGGVVIPQRLADFGIRRSRGCGKSRYCHGYPKRGWLGNS